MFMSTDKIIGIGFFIAMALAVIVSLDLALNLKFFGFLILLYNLQSTRMNIVGIVFTSN